MYKLFLDDYRDPSYLHGRFLAPSAGEWVIARSAEEAKDYILQQGLPFFIAFDHDLADEHYHGAVDERTGLSFARWLTSYIDESQMPLPENFNWIVHSMNPVGAQAIRNHMDSWYRRK